MEHKERKRSKIVPIGLNNSTPDNVVEDGSLEVCNNLRFANGAWRNVCNFSSQSLPDALKDKDMIHIHPTDNTKVFISKKQIPTTYTKVKYYALRSIELGIDSPQLYYTDKPTHSLIGADLYTMNPQKKLGKIQDFRNEELSYISDDLVGKSHYTLYSASVIYDKMNRHIKETFYFLSDSLDPRDDSANAVFVKKDDKFIYFGKANYYDEHLKKYIISEYKTGIEIYARIGEITSNVYKFRMRVNYTNMYGTTTYIYYDSIEDGCLFFSSAHDAFGYMHDTCVSAGSSSPKYTYIDERKTYICYDAEGNEVPFDKVSGESFDDYTKRYYTSLDEELQIVGGSINLSLSYLTDEDLGGVCASLYTWQLEEASDIDVISQVFVDEKNNITSSIEVNKYTLEMWDEEGNSLGEVGSYNDDFAIDHFGNMLIVREESTCKTYFYLFSQNKYQVYGSQGGINISFDIGVEERIHSPKMCDVPMFYKAPGVSASDGSLDGRMFLGAGEPILDINKSNFDSLNTASNVHLIDNHNGYFRGEFAVFLVARAKDGTEIYRTAPQIVRSETILGQSANVFLYTPYSESIKKNYDADYEKLEEEGANDNPNSDIKRVYDYEECPYTYLVWGYKEWDKSRGTISGYPYAKWRGWVNSNKKRKEELQNFLDSHTASDLYKLKLNVSAEGNNIEEIVIYSTRLYPLFVIEKDAITTNPVDLLDEPFYEMKVLTNKDKEFIITYNDLKNIEAKTAKVYQVSQNAEDVFFAKHAVEYNNCYHAYGIHALKPNIASNSLVGTEGGETNFLATSRLYNNAVVYAPYEVDEVIDTYFENPSFSNNQGYCLSFTDSLLKVFFGKKNTNGTMSVVTEFTPKYSSSINCSYVVNDNKETFDSDDAGMVQPNVKWTPTSFNDFVASIANASRSSVKYKKIIIVQEDDTEDSLALEPSYPIPVGNRVQVSDYGNPLTNPYDRSYRIGTSRNEIIAMGSAVLKLSDAKFGEFPMYVFTKEGIFAMQTGQESMYVSIIPISKDVIINPNTLGLSNAVLFFTEKGLHLLSNEGIKLLSAGLHDQSNRIPDWMRTCRLVHLPEFNEVMCVLMDGDAATGEAYCFSPENNCWYHRAIPTGKVFNDTSIRSSISTMHQLTQEGKTVVDKVVMKTRPIKLGAGKELKRLETLIVRFESDEPQDIEVEILGSVDGVKWFDEPLRRVPAKTNTDVLIRRTPCSVKYLKFVVKCSNLSSNIRIIGFDTEHYLRFSRRLR